MTKMISRRYFAYKMIQGSRTEENQGECSVGRDLISLLTDI